MKQRYDLKSAGGTLELEKDAIVVIAPADITLRAIVGVALWSGLGWNMVIYLAGLQGIPVHLYESAVLDGAGPGARFRHITWPLLKPTTFFIFVTSVIGASQVFGTVYVMTNGQGGPGSSTVVSELYIYRAAFADQTPELAAAAAVLLFIATLGLIVSFFRLQRSGEGAFGD